MTNQFILSCPHCNEAVPVETRHAGSSLACPHCEASLDVPKLRELNKLERVAPQSAERQQRGWGGLSGGLFAGGLLLLAIAAGAAYYVNVIRADYKPYATRPDQEGLRFQLDISKASLTDSWKVWDELLKRREIVQRPTPEFIRMRKVVQRLDIWTYFFYGLATVGLIAMISSVFFRPRLAN